MPTLESLPSIRPTRRGIGVAVVVVFAFALGVTGGARSLNAVVVPGLVGLAAGGIQVARASGPTVERSTPDPGFVGATRRVTLEVEADLPCTVTDRIGDGLTLAGGEPTASVGHDGSLAYDVVLERRGEHRLGPTVCRLTDALGLFSRSVETVETSTSIVYPEVYPVEAAAMSDIVAGRLGHDRSSFEHLREFVPGDALRDVDWRASAKRSDDEFVVAEYRNRSGAARVGVAGEAAVGCADAMASTVASVATHLQDAGVPVTVTVPGGHVVARPGETRQLLQLLARTGDGRLDDENRTNAAVVVSGEPGGTTVSIDDRELDADRVIGERRDREVFV